jgi:hypothetical protein
VFWCEAVPDADGDEVALLCHEAQPVLELVDTADGVIAAVHVHEAGQLLAFIAFE